MYRGHVNEKLHTTFRNSGRVAGTGILYDRYDEESGNPEYEKRPFLVHFPSDSLTGEELLALNGPVCVVQERKRMATTPEKEGMK